jgi:4-hydroxybenzoyl-CoA reductase subunit beta
MGTVGGNLCLDTRCYWYNQSYSWRVSCGFCLKKDGTVCHVASGGKLCWAVYSGDLAPALMTLRAELKIAGPRGERRVHIESFYVNEGRAKFDLRPDEILTEVFVPPASADCFGSYQKFRIRGSVDYPLAGVAVAAKKEPDGRIHDVRAALTAVNPAPQLVPGVNSVFGQQGTHADLMEEVVRLALRSARPLKTSASTMEYRRHMLAVMLRRALPHWGQTTE